ncbi:DUF4190 domain-containing protein [Amycolatopsis sp. NPDC004378]
MTIPDPYAQEPPAQLPVPIEPAWRPQYPVSAPVPVQQPYPGPYNAMPYPMLRTSGLCVAGMVIGILALIGFWIPFGDVFMGALAIALSWAGMVQSAKPGYTGRGMGIAGLVCGILAIIPAIIVVVLFLSFGVALI